MLPFGETVKNQTVSQKGASFMSKKQKLGIEEKVDIVRRCLSRELGINEASRVAGVAKISIQRWIMQYKTDGASAFLPCDRNRAYSPELKRRAVLDYQAGKGSLLEICKSYKM